MLFSADLIFDHRHKHILLLAILTVLAPGIYVELELLERACINADTICFHYPDNRQFDFDYRIYEKSHAKKYFRIGVEDALRHQPENWRRTGSGSIA